MKKLIFSLIAIIFINTLLLAQNSWNQKSCMYNYGRHVAISFTIGNKAYVGLGEKIDGSMPVDFWEYNPCTNRWTKKANFPGGGRYAATGFTINGKGYVCLCLKSDEINAYDLWEYNPTNDTWTIKADFPGTPRYGASCFVIGDSAFIGTGSYGMSDDYLYDIWMYVPQTDTWKRKSDFPGLNRLHATAFSIGHFGFMGTGLSDDITPTRDFWKYSPVYDHWYRCSDFPDIGRLGCTSFVINNSGFVGLGFDQDVDYNNFYIYSPEADYWEGVNVDTNIIARRGSLGFSIGRVGYFCTGESKDGLLPDLWSFDFDPIDSDPIVSSEDQIFLIYPSPSQDFITIESSSNFRNNVVSIYNAIGQELIKVPLSNRLEVVDIRKFVIGTYFAKIRDQRKVKTVKFVKDY